LPAEVPPVPSVEAEPVPDPLPAAEPAVPTDELDCPPPADVPPVPSVEAEPEPEPVPDAEPAVPTEELDMPPPAEVPPVPSVELDDSASTSAALPARKVAVNAASERFRRIISFFLLFSSTRDCEMESSHATTVGQPIHAACVPLDIILSAENVFLRNYCRAQVRSVQANASVGRDLHGRF
jgi:hypothetical protein